MRNLLFTLLALLIAAPAMAIDSWVGHPGASAGTFPCDFNTNRICWWDVTEAGSLDVTTVLDAQICENITVSWFNNIAAATFNNLAEVWDNSGGFTISATDLTAEKVGGVDLTGNPAAPGLFSHYGFDAGFVYVRFTMNDVGSTGRIKAHCHPRAD